MARARLIRRTGSWEEEGVVVRPRPVANATQLTDVLTNAAPFDGYGPLAAGDAIELTAGVVYQGPFTLPVVPGASAAAPVWIRTAGADTAFPRGTRVGVTDIGEMAEVRSQVSGPGEWEGAIVTAPLAAYWIVHGLYLQGMANDGYGTVPYTSWVVALTDYGDYPSFQEGRLPHHLTVRGCVIRGSATGETYRGVAVWADDVTIRDCHIDQVLSSIQDTQCIEWLKGARLTVENCRLVSGTETFMAGGADIPFQSQMPTTLVVRRCWFERVDAHCRWSTGFSRDYASSDKTFVTGTATAGGASTITLQGDASGVDDYYQYQHLLLTGGTGSGQSAMVTAYNGTTKVATIQYPWAYWNGWVVPDATTTYSLMDASYLGPSLKNQLELKMVNGALIEGCVFTGFWADGQRAPIVLTSVNQSGGNDWSTVSAVTFRNNIIKDTPSALLLHGYYWNDCVKSDGLTITNNVVCGIDYTGRSGVQSGTWLVEGQHWDNVTITHNTFWGPSLNVGLGWGGEPITRDDTSSNGLSSNFVYRDNIVPGPVAVIEEQPGETLWSGPLCATVFGADDGNWTVTYNIVPGYSPTTVAEYQWPGPPATYHNHGTASGYTVAAMESTHFTDVSEHDYRLTDNGLLTASSTGGAPGCDIDELYAAMSPDDWPFTWTP